MLDVYDDNNIIKENKVSDESDIKKSNGEEALQVIRIKKEQLIKTLVPVIMRQTNYTEEQAKEKIEEHNYELKKILYEWMNIPIKKQELTCNTSNQERYRLIRKTLDNT